MNFAHIYIQMLTTITEEHFRIGLIIRKVALWAVEFDDVIIFWII